jgi:predicted nucleic acid-binding protein
LSRYVVDASLVFKWFVPEMDAEAAAELRYGTHVLLAPDLLLPELTNVLWKRTRRGEITEEEGHEILRAFTTFRCIFRPPARV